MTERKTLALAGFRFFFVTNHFDLPLACVHSLALLFPLVFLLLLLLLFFLNNIYIDV